jgi:uncharacterized protein YdaU (DUF1376 family)
MHWYKRHLGDYASRTGHLSVWEHGALTLLLDRHYAREKPLTDSDVNRICRPKTKLEKEVVRRILDEFFVRTDSGYINNRAMREIEEFHVKSKKASNAAKGRWMRTQGECNANAMLSKNLEPTIYPLNKNNPRALAGYTPSTKQEVQRDGSKRISNAEWVMVAQPSPNK